MLAETKKIRLLIITPSLACGGSEKFVSVLCNQLNTEKFAVCLVIANNSKPFYTITNPAVALINLKKNRVLFSLFSIKAVVNDFEPDIIFSTANHLNLYLAIFRSSFDKEIQFIAREASIVSINSRRAKFPALYNWLIRKYYNRFDRIICQSAYMQQDLVSHYHIDAGKTVLINNAVPDLVVPPRLAENTATERVYTFVSVARLSEEKGIERLIQAVGLLSMPFQYYIIGEGDKKKDLQKLINELQLTDQVHLAGEKAQPFTGMEHADLFLMGSYYEGFPNALLEAGAYGIPVMAFDAPGGIGEIIVEGKNGMLVADNDIIAFAAAINTALNTSFNRDQIIETTKKRFGINSIIPALEDLFLSLAGNK
ncbi:MAG: glycosyltransferase [Ferruginibacter sp.]